MSKINVAVTALARGLAEAVAKDETPEAGGCDISAGMFGPHASQWLRDVAEGLMKPIDMVLHCPACGMQHIDAPDEHPELRDIHVKPWDNPPHRSHLCAGCGHIWRPADVPTNGVQAVKTRGKADAMVQR
jgi:hypothetical protein